MHFSFKALILRAQSTRKISTLSFVRVFFRPPPPPPPPTRTNESVTVPMPPAKILDATAPDRSSLQFEAATALPHWHRVPAKSE
jgi:hypothetical protein